VTRIHHSPTYRALLAHRAFALLWIGQAISTFGDALYDVALLWYVFGATHSALAAGGIAVAVTAGRLLASIPAGAIVDRASLRLIMLLADLARGILTLAVGLAWLHGAVPPLSLLYGLTFLVSAGGAFFDPARAAAVPAILPADHLVVANALDGLFASLTFLVTWALSGFIVAAIGPAYALLLDAGTFLASCCLVAGARWDGDRPVVAPIADVPGQQPVAGLREGLRWAWQDRPVRAMLLAQGAFTATSALFFTGLVPYVRQHLHGGTALYGLQGAVFAAGLGVASWLIGRRSVRRLGLLYSLGLVVNGVGNSLFALAPSIWYLLPAVFVAGLGRAAHMTGERTLLQIRAPARLRGRVFVLWGTLAQVIAVPMLALGGWLSDHLTAQPVLLVASLMHIGIGLWLRSRPYLAHAESHGG